MATTDQVKDKASDALINMIDITVKSMSDVVEFGKQQIPEVIHQLLMWEMAKGIIGFSVGVIFAIVTVIFFRKACQWYQEDSSNAPAHIGTAVLLVISSILLIDNIMIIVQIWVAPKLYLLEYAASLIKGGN